MLAHVRDRPLTMRRFANGVEGRSFFEKHVPAHAPDWVRTVAVPSTAADGPRDTVEYPVVCDAPTLLWAANLACLEFHVPLWHVGRRRRLPGPPDHLVVDLDPGPGATIVECCEVAALVRARLESLALVAFPKTSGSKGLQLYAPVPSRTGWDELREAARQLAVRLEASHPELVVSRSRRSLRDGKVLIDWGQDHPARTTVAAYSLRGRPEPTVSTPVTWQEVDACASSKDAGLLVFTSDDVLGRVGALGDLFAPVAAAARR